MEKVRFGKTDLMVSRIALGGIPIERISISDAVAVILRAISLGVNFIDTANGYTDSEEKIGQAIKDIPRDSLIIATKSPARDKKTFLEHLDLSLKRLGTDYVDVYQHHNISSSQAYDEIMGEGGAFEGMTEAIRAGKVRYPAFSSHNIPTATMIMRDGHYASVQLPFNYIDDQAAIEAVPLAKELDMGFIAMKPFGGGMLVDAKLAIKYLLQFDSVVPDPGVNKLSEIEEIVRIVQSGERLTEDDCAAIAKEKVETGDHWCHRCDYCQPCPQKIAISMSLTVEATIKRVPYRRTSVMLGNIMENARGCIRCRECVSRCPYGLDIPELLIENLAVWDRYLAENS